MSEFSSYPQPPEVYKQWIDTLVMEAQDKMTAWENDFIASISSRYANLSEKQARVLERIYAEKT